MNQDQLPTALKCLALAGALLCASEMASAGLVVFTDPAAFTAAAGAVKTETFNAFTSDLAASPSSPSHDFGDFRVGSSGWLIDAPSTRNAIDGTTNLFLSFSNAGHGAFSEFNFAEPITAFGFWYSGRRSDLGADQASRINVDANSLDGYGSYAHVGTIELQNGGAARFIGVTADRTFNRIVFQGLGCCTTSYSLDNVMYTGVADVPGPGGSVPVPGSLPLAAIALGLLAWRSRALASKPETLHPAGRRPEMSRARKFRRTQPMTGLLWAALASSLGGAGAAAAQGNIEVGGIRELEGASGQRTVYLPVRLPADMHPQTQLFLSALPRNGAGAVAVGGETCTAGVDFITVVDRPFRLNSAFPHVPVTICGDTVVDGDKFVIVRVSNGSGRMDEGDLLIVDDDALPRLIGLTRVVNVQRSPIPFVRTPATFEVRLSHASPSGDEIRIPYYTENGTAQAGGCRFEWVPNASSPSLGSGGFRLVCTGDYEARNDVLRLPPGATQGSFSIPVLGSSSPRSSWFGIRIGTPVNAAPGLANTWSAVANIEPAASYLGSQASVAPFGRTAVLTPPRELPNGRLTVLALEWRAPDGQPWNTVETLDFRPADPSAGGAWWRWERHSGQFSLCHPTPSDGAASRLNARCQPAAGAEAMAIGGGRLHPSLSRVQGSASEPGRLELHLTFSFTSKGTSNPAQRVQLEVAASDRFGSQGGFESVLEAPIGRDAKAR